MKLILLSGGSGKRLWPLSNDVRSKQFLKVLHNPQGEQEAMVQRVWRQLAETNWPSPVYISSSDAHVDLIHSQLGEDVSLIIEPEKRDTFPAISLAASFLHTCEGASLDEIVIIMPVDAYVELSFMEKMKELENVLRLSGADLALIGVTPTYPSTKYGYIVPRKAKEERKESPLYYEVHSFKEKPSTEKAKDLLERQAFWNCGVFAFRLGYLIRELAEKNWPTDYHVLLQQYGKLPKISFDYEIVEKAEKVVVVPYSENWKDLGTWNTLTEEMNVEAVGRVHLDESCSNTHVLSELDIPVVTIGLANTVVAASPDGILVAAKEKSHLVKDIAMDWNHRPMYEEKRWGWYHVLHFQKTEEKGEVLTKRLHIHAGKNLSYQYHHKRSEVWMVVSGEGEFILDDQLRFVGPGDVLEIPVGAKHSIRALKDLEFIEVQMGSQLIEEDIVRLGMTWREIIEQVANPYQPKRDAHD
ncbi:sugar phosphate nucleotidyltransferase [Brevibacillus choshinensis]|uniref:Cupin domain-containing protein n=1 Tax=Brevibacillus choshinensis TaxID=54911 RepID=A0ABX7FSX5_BRECH|nr:sugar phosphate nucleotidyltransferase [Brevibacillus choshinensis]QRG69331.1 cupin domain-containing protein [Brevibacillus choshinensis]